MKNILPFFCFIVVFASCTKEDDIQNTNGTKLISIDYKDGNKTIDSWKELFSYDNGVIDKIEDLYSLGTRYQMEYKNNQLQEYSTYTISDDNKAFRDSIAYNQNGTIRAIYNFSINSGVNLPLSWIYEFEYSVQNKVSEKKSYFVDKDEYTSIEKYYWNNNNIEKIEYYNAEEVLRYEFFYLYDNKINYKKGIPIYISDPISWSENNKEYLYKKKIVY